MSDQEEVIKQVYLELDQIRQVKKCTSCECLLDVLDAVQEDLSKVGTPQAKTALEICDTGSRKGMRSVTNAWGVKSVFLSNRIIGLARCRLIFQKRII